MKGRKKIVAISGSTRRDSTNLSLINAIIDLFSDKFDFRVFQGLADLPHFNPDLDTEQAPAEVLDFRRCLKESDGILICTPEYAMGVPGTLKNAIDWTVSSMEFSHKPVALITASSDGKRGHQSLLETLRIIESDLPDSLQLLIPFVKTKVNGNKIIDAATLGRVRDLVQSLENTIDKQIDANKST